MKQITLIFSLLFLFISSAYAQCPSGAIASASSNPICKGDSTQLTTALLGGCSSYTVTNIPNTTITGIATNVILGNDQVSAALPIGFTFNFFCLDYTQFYISSNGFITFTPSSPDGCCSGQFIPNAAAPNNLIALAWEDYNPSAGGTINYFTAGTAPNRTLVVNFTTVPHFGGGGGALNGQLVLYETTNIIDIQINSQTSDGGLHTQGIEDASGTIALASPGRNAANWSTANNGKRFTPGSAASGSFTYNWVPSTGLSNPNISNPMASPLQTTTYVVTVSDVSCPSVSDTIIISVDTTTISVSILNPDTFICAGGTVQMAIADTGAATYLWSPSTALSCTTCPNPIASPSFTTTYYVTAYTPMGICSATDTMTISVGNLNQILITASATSMCSAGDTVQLDASAVNSNCSTYTDINIPFAPVVGSGTPITLLDDQMSAVLPIGFSFNFYCNNYTDFYISSNGFITFNNDPNSGCYSGQLLPDVVTPNNLISFAWDDLDPSSGGTIDYFTTGSAPNRRLIVNFNNVPHFGAGGGPVSAQVALNESSNIIEIHTTSMLTDGTAHTMGLEDSTGSMAHPITGRNADATWSAANEGIRFIPGSASANLTYSWVPATGLSNDSIANPLAFPTITTTYTVTVADSVCILSDTITIYVDTNMVTVNIITPDTTICYGDNVQINTTSAGAATYLWSPATGLSCTTCSNPIATPSFTTTYYVTAYSLIGACSSTDTIAIGVSSLTQITPTASPNPACGAGDSVQLNVAISGVPPSGYCNPTYSAGCTSGDFINNFSFNTIVNNLSGCTTNPNSYTYYPTSTTVIAGNTYNLSMQAGSQWQQGFGVWIDYNQDGDFNDPTEFVYASPTAATTVFNTTIVIPMTAFPGTTRLRVLCNYATTVTATQSCLSTTFGECEDYNVLISGPQSNFTYNWAPAASVSNSTIANPIATPTALTTYTVTVTDTLAGCSLSGVVTVTVTPAPTANISPASATICAGQFTTLTASGGGTYLWSSGQSTAAITVAPFTSTNYTVTVTNAAGCTDDAVVSVTVNPLPFISISGSTSICSGQSATLTATGGSTYVWSSGQTTNPIVVAPSANTTYSVIGTNASGCTNSSAVTVTVLPQPVASFTFSIAGTTATFTSTSQNATSWNWNFGDASTSTLQNPVHIYTTAGTYTVTLVVSNGCGSDTTTAVVIITTGVEEYAGNYSLTVFPNPATDKITVNIEAINPSVTKGTLTVYNAIGKEIYYMDIPRIGSSWKHPIEFDAASAGIYLIKITLDDAVLTRRVVINK